MRLYLLCLAAVVSAFAIGFGFADFYFYRVKKRANNSGITTTQMTENITSPTPNSNDDSSPVEETDFEEKAAFVALKPTIGKWLSGAPIKSVFTDASDESIREITGKERSEMDDPNDVWLMGLRFEPTLMDFNGDGQNELAIRNLCAMVGNCSFTVFRKKGESYEIILESEGGAVQTFKLERTKSNGYFDLKTTAHGDAWSGGIEIYKFDGAKYKVAECFNYDYAALVDGKRTVWKKPRITPRKCAEE
jgi:hypothetical protein